MSGETRISLITAGTGGIGKAIAAGLAARGGTVIVTGRDRDRGELAVEEIRKQSGNPAVELMPCDHSSQAGIRGLAARFRERHGRLDVLVNNVGGLYGKHWETVDGIEGTLAVNHLAPYLLTHLLLPALFQSAAARIVNINSEGHRAAKTVDVEQLWNLRWRRGFPVYSQSKLANLLFTYELARRLQSTGITVNAVHPGIVDTPLFRRFIDERFFLTGGAVSRAIGSLIRQIAYRRMKFDTAETAASCPVYLATAPEAEGVTGQYFNLDKTMLTSSPASRDEALAARVWKASAALCSLPDRAADPADMNCAYRGNR